jgi:Flp pilus assembly protein TadB
MSALILVLLPMGLFLIINFMNPDYFVPLYESPDKYIYIGVFAGFELVALVWIRWIINIDA